MSAMLLSACASNDTPDKAQTGAIIGTIAGAVLGAKVSKNNRGAGAVIGAALGGATGYIIGRQLDERDRIALQAKIDELANSSQSGEPAIWKSEHSGASAQIVMGDPVSTGETTKRVVTEADVELPRSTLRAEVGKRYASANVNVRTGPSTLYAVKYVLPAGRQVELAGAADNGFNLISDNGVIIGYVSSKYLSSIPMESKKIVVQQGTTSEIMQGKQSASETEPAVRPSIPQREADLRVSSQCRPVTIRVRSKDGQITEEKVQTCMRADGTWGS